MYYNNGIKRNGSKMFKKNLKKTSMTLDVDDFQLFKKITKINNSDASKTIRQFIEDYIKKNQQIVIKIKSI